MAAKLPVGVEELQVPGDEDDWVEVWDNWFVVPGEGRGGYVRLTLRPSDGVTWYWASLVGFDRPLVTVLVDDAPSPRNGRLEIRAPGLWTETSVLRPFEHLTTDLEAFGVAIDAPGDVWSGAWGDRVAVGFELDWDTDGEPGPSPAPGTAGYRLVGRFHGEVLLDESRWTVEGIGVRDHWWGVPTERSSWRGWASQDDRFVHSDGGRLDIDLDRIVEELPVGSVGSGVEVVGWAPALGGSRRYARALVTGADGAGWFEIVR